MRIPPPHLGSVSAQPSIGYEFLTVFRIDALGFVDDEDNYPLTYSFGYLDEGIERIFNLKNQSVTYFSMLPYTGGYTLAFVRVYDSFGTSQIYTSRVTVALNEKLNVARLLKSYIHDVSAIFYDIQTTVSTLTLLGTGILNREYTLTGEFTLQTGAQMALLQKTFAFCIDITNKMLNNIDSYY